MAIGYTIPYNGSIEDIGDIAAPAYSDTIAPCVYFGKAGFITNNKTGDNDNKFLAVTDTDPWKTGIGAINYYKSDKEKLTNDIASIYSCPNFKKVIGFYGDGTQPHTTAKKIFEHGKTYRLKVKRDDNSLLISIGKNATNGFTLDYQYKLKSSTGKPLPTALIVGIQAAGGNGGGGSSAMGSGWVNGAGGGAGAYCYIVLDWNAAQKKMFYEKINNVIFDFYITPITDWKTIAAYSDKFNTCNNSCIAVNLKDDWYSTSSNESIKSKLIIGCGQDAYSGIYGKAGVVKNYDLEAKKTYDNEVLSEYGIYILDKYSNSTESANAGNGSGAGSAGKASNSYYWLTTKTPVSSITSSLSNYQSQYLYEYAGGSAASKTGAGGGGASNFAQGGSGANSGSNGTLGSGGGGSNNKNDKDKNSKGGLPYIFFCSNMDLTVTK